jgi:hypothetical protein
LFSQVSIVAEPVLFSGDPGSCEMVDHGRFEPVQHGAADVEEAGTPRAPQEFAAGRRQNIAADGVNIDRELYLRERRGGDANANAFI